MRVVIPSVNYGDFLKVTLPEWCKILGRENIIVVTSPGDVETKIIAQSNKCDLYITDAWTANNAVFNKAAALDEAFGFTPRTGYYLSHDERKIEPVALDEVCLTLDADCYPFGKLPHLKEIAANTIYGCYRYACPDQWALNHHIAGTLGINKFEKITSWSARQLRSQHGHVPNVTCGYFQMWRNNDRRKFGSFRAADEYDVRFSFTFATGKILEPIYVLHCGLNLVNWHGRISPRWELTPK